VVQLGHIDDADREDAYAGCDVFCLPSSAEAFGLVVLEAWGYGKPVVASDIPTLRERLARGGGLTAPLEPVAMAEALARILSDSQLRDRLGAEGRAQASDATWSATARSMTSIYEAAAAGRSL
jgi:glycosyltransferase involved in cell wall biosynthesis